MTDWAFDDFKPGAPPRPPAPAREASKAWPKCGARTRAGRPCVAPGAGVGGRCPNHGGVPHGGPFVLLPGLDPEDRFNGEDMDPRRWTARLVPTDLWRAVSADGARDFELSLFDYRAGTPASDPLRKKTERWPQLVGLRVARRLVERGRVSVAVVDSARTAKKLGVLRPAAWSDEQWSAWVAEHAVCADSRGRSALSCRTAAQGAEPPM